MNLPWVYIAGPYTKPDPIANTHNALNYADEILRLGGFPVIPHLTMLWHLFSPKEYGFWLEYDKEFLLKCDALFRIWGESYGADQEEKVAHIMGIPVFNNFYDLKRFLDKKVDNGTTT